MKRQLVLRSGSARRGQAAVNGLTLVEMLVAMSITLLMMAAVVTVFANVSGSVNRRRATIEMAGELRGAREMLSRDLENATCPTLPPRRPEANEGYLEIIEGPQNDFYPSAWLYDSPANDNGEPDGLGNGANENWPRIDLQTSSLPGSNLRGASTPVDEEGRGVSIGSNGAEDSDDELPESAPTDGRGLGDADDILMLTVRNERDPFVGRIPNRSDANTPASGADFPSWGFEEFESPLAEVVWFAVENPPERDNQRTFAFGEPGYRTIYRRALLIAPWLNYRIPVGNELTGPGVVRVLNLQQDQVIPALAALVAFQERYDLSVRLEWDPLVASGTGRWLLKANSLADLTKPENRYEHHGLSPTAGARVFPFSAVSAGAGYNGGEDVMFVVDPEYTSGADPSYEAVADDRVVAYEARASVSATDLLSANDQFPIRPLAYPNANTTSPATARAVLNEDGSVVRVMRGLAPLGRHVLANGTVIDRRGDDVVMTNALAFDLKVYDPGAPLYSYFEDGDTNDADGAMVVEPSDPAWGLAYQQDAQNGAPGDGLPVASPNYPFVFQRQGAYVDLGYGLSFIDPSTNPGRVSNQFDRVLLTGWTASAATREPVFFVPGWRPSTTGAYGSPEYSVYDTWSWHYENNGIDDDDRDGDGDASTGVDEGANGFDDPGVYQDAVGAYFTETALGVDDPGERETRPPYPAALRGLEATLRVYERDSLQIREAKVRESFVPE